MIFYVTGFYRAQYSKMHAKQDYILYEPILNLPRVDLCYNYQGPENKLSIKHIPIARLQKKNQNNLT